MAVISGDKMPNGHGEISIWNLQRLTDYQAESTVYKMSKVNSLWAPDAYVGAYRAVQQGRDETDDCYFVFGPTHLIVTKGEQVDIISYRHFRAYTPSPVDKKAVSHGALVLFCDNDDMILLSMDGSVIDNGSGTLIRMPNVDISNIMRCIKLSHK